MDLMIETDDFGRFVCTLVDGDATAMVTASNPDAGDALTEALDALAGTGQSECLWAEANGEYRWMFRRDDDRLTVVVLWSAGTLTGWQHVFRAEGEFARFRARATEAVRRAARPGVSS